MEEARGLSCSVCYNAFTSVDDQSVPRNLNCGHTFCSACLTKIAAQSLHVYIKCPACKTETPLLAKCRSIACLPKNFGLLEIIECKEKQSNTNHASVCDKSDTDKRKSYNNVCEEHDEAKKVYCFTDQCLICIYCQIYGNHQGHNCELASTLAKSSREELQKISEKLESECDMLCKATSEISDMENSIVNRQLYLKSRLKKYMIMLHHNLTRQEAHIISQIDELTKSKLEVLETQEKTLNEVIAKCNELYHLIQTVQNDSDNCVIEDKPTIEKLVDEMSYLAEACQMQPQAENNLMFEFDKDVLNILQKVSGTVMELKEADEEQTDSSGDFKQHLLDDALSNLEQEMHVCNTQLSHPTEQQDNRAEHTDTESEENEDDDDEEEEGGEGHSESSSYTSGIDESEQEEAENRNMDNANADEAEDDRVASEGELLGAVGGSALPEAQQDENKCKDINENQSLLRELQHEIERLKLLGPTGEVIRVIDDSSASSTDGDTDTDDNDHDNTHSVQLGFLIRVNNDLGRTKSRATGGTAVQTAIQGMLPNKDTPSRDRRKHRCGKKHCSVVNCQHHVHPTLQCKNCCRVFCWRCASLSLTCNKSDCGHSFVSYGHSGHHLSKNIKSKCVKNSVSKLRKTCQRGSSELALRWVCKRCTMQNKGHVLVCGACETSKDYDPEGSRNVCPMCTLVNEPGKTNCELCDTDLQETE